MGNKNNYRYLVTPASMKMLTEIRRKAYMGRRYYEAALIENVLVEVSIREFILQKLMLKKEEDKMDKYWSSSRTKFYQLIDYAELLGLSKNLVQNLREYSNGRNKLVHGVLEFQNKKNLYQASRSNLFYGIETESLLAG